MSKCNRLDPLIPDLKKHAPDHPRCYRVWQGSSHPMKWLSRMRRMEEQVMIWGLSSRKYKCKASLVSLVHIVSMGGGTVVLLDIGAWSRY